MPLGFPNVATHCATYIVLILVSQVGKAKCVLWLHEAKSMVSVKRRFQRLLQEECFSDMLFQQDGVPPLFPSQSEGLYWSPAPTEMDWQGWVYHLAVLFTQCNSLFIISLGGALRMLCMYFHWLPLCWNLPSG